MIEVVSVLDRRRGSGFSNSVVCETNKGSSARFVNINEGYCTLLIGKTAREIVG